MLVLTQQAPPTQSSTARAAQTEIYHPTATTFAETAKESVSTDTPDVDLSFPEILSLENFSLDWILKEFGQIPASVKQRSHAPRV